MWEKRATSAEGKIYSNSRVLGYGQLGGHTRPCAKVLLKCASMVKEEMLLPNYTKWSGMSCGGKTDHDESWSGKRRSFGELVKMVMIFNISKHSLLIFFIKDIEMSK